MRRDLRIAVLVGFVLLMVLTPTLVWAQEGGNAGTPETRKESVLQLINKGGNIGYLIIMISAAMFALILMNVMALKRSNLIPDSLVAEVDKLLRNKQAKAALELCQGDTSLTGRMMAAGISRMPRGFDQATDYMGEVGAESAMRFQHHVSYLSVIGAIAPMLGLLGTVVGMVGAFRVIATAGGQPNVATMAGNIQLALMTTVMGLIVAIPAIFSYALLKNRLARMLTEVDMVTAELMSRFQGVTAPLRGVKTGPVATETPSEPEATDSSSEG